MKSILFLIPSLGGGGAERQAVTIAVLLKKRGYNVGFLVYAQDTFFEPILKEANIPVSVKLGGSLKRIVSFTRYIHRGRYDAVISFMPTPNFLNCFAGILGKRWRIITSERTANKVRFTNRQGRIYSCFYRWADAIVCNSDNAKRMWLHYYPQYKEKLSTIYNTVKLGAVNSEYRPRRDGRTHLIIAASVYKIKNPMGLINAVELMSQEERDTIQIDWYGKREVTTGDHFEYDRVVRAINDKGLSEIVRLHDATNDIANKMNEADCVGLFSELEGLPNAICEGMMLNKPIVMSRCSDYNVLVKEGENGFLCDWNKPETIKKALVQIAQIDTKQLLNMGAASGEKASNLFEQEVILNQWINEIEKNAIK